MRTRTRFLAVAAVALFAAQTRAQENLSEATKLSVSLSEVTSFPEAYRRVPFDLELLYHGPRDLYNPYYTLFEPANYLNFAAWTADQPIWTRDAFVNDYPLFYVERKNTALEHAMVSMKPFTWFTARCIVRSTAQGHAWIEVLSVVEAAATLDTTDLRHLVRGNVLASGGEFDRALLEFGMAKMFGAPPKFVARYHADEGRTALAANQPTRALAELTAALAVLPDDKELVALLDRASGSVQEDRQQQVASVPSNVPPPLNLNGNAPAPKPLEPKPVVAKPVDVKPQAETAKPVVPAPGIDPIAPPADAPKSDPKPEVMKSDAPKSDVPKADAPTTEPAKVEPATPAAPKSDAPATDAPKSEPAPVKPATTPVEVWPSNPAVEPKADPTPAAKPDANPAPKDDEAKVPAEKKEPLPDPDAPKDGDKPEEKKDAPGAPKADGDKQDGTPAPDMPKPEEKKDGMPDPDAPKDGDKPEEKKEGEPAPDAPKPEGKPDDGKPDEKPAEKPADEPKSGGR